jgi:D-glycero-D-manno-heptose 1,7-bisphosphate phosphatase
MSEKSASGPFALLDLDGTIMVDKAYLGDPDGIEFTPSAVEGSRRWRDAVFPLVLITNQSGGARVVFDMVMLDHNHRRLQSMLPTEGARLAGINYCPHRPDERRDCRKPAPGMRNAARDLGVRPDEAVLIGGSDADIETASAAGVRAVRLPPKGNSRVEAAPRACAILAFGSGGDAACT